MAQETGAIPYDIPGVELTHMGDLCSFDAFLKRYHLVDPALARRYEQEPPLTIDYAGPAGVFPVAADLDLKVGPTLEPVSNRADSKAGEGPATDRCRSRIG